MFGDLHFTDSVLHQALWSFNSFMIEYPEYTNFSELLIPLSEVFLNFSGTFPLFFKSLAISIFAFEPQVRFQEELPLLLNKYFAKAAESCLQAQRGKQRVNYLEWKENTQIWNEITRKMWNLHFSLRGRKTW